MAFFGTPVSLAQFKPDDLNVHSSYYRGPVQQRALPTGVLAALAIVLLLIFLLWYALCTHAINITHHRELILSLWRVGQV